MKNGSPQSFFSQFSISNKITRETQDVRILSLLGSQKKYLVKVIAANSSNPIERMTVTVFIHEVRDLEWNESMDHSHKAKFAFNSFFVMLSTHRNFLCSVLVYILFQSNSTIFIHERNTLGSI